MTASPPDIVIVEDDVHVRSLLVRALTRWFPDAQLVDVASGEEAWEQLQRQAPRVLLTDYLLPGITGIELAERARASKFQFPIVLISALTLDPQMLGAVNHFLPKPLTMPSLRRIFSELLIEQTEG